MKVRGMKTWKELTTGVQQLVRLLFNNNFINSGLVLKSVIPSRRNRSFSTESPFLKPAKTSENTKQDFPLFSFLAIMTLGCVHAFYPHGRMESPGISYSHAGEDFNPLTGKQVLKRAESHR